MSRINTNVSSLLAQTVLSQQNKQLTTSMERLSTGLQINRGSDNPAGLIASEKLRSEETAITAATANAQRADQVVNIAEGGLQEINSMLLQVQNLVGQSANQSGISVQEKQANQLQIDSILQSIDRIASTTSFQGTKLLNGSYDFTISGQAGRVVDYQINAAKLTFNGTRAVQVTTTASAQHGSLFLSYATSSLALATGSAFNFELAGAKGSREFTFASGAKLSAMAAQVNTYSTVTGVSAVASGRYMALRSTDFGSDQFVSFKLTNRGNEAGGVILASALNETKFKAASSQAFSTLTNAVKDTGQDLGAIINGVAATAQGRAVRVNTDFLDLSLTLSAGGAQTLGTFSAFTITGGGAQFALGPNVDILNQVSLGIKNVATRNLGDVTNGYLSSLASGSSNNLVTGNLATAQNIVNSAIDQVSALRGRLGAFQQNVVGSTINSLGVALENTTAAQSSIRDTDFAAETAKLTRAQILVQAATQVLTIANSQPQQVLTLLKNA